MEKKFILPLALLLIAGILLSTTAAVIPTPQQIPMNCIIYNAHDYTLLGKTQSKVQISNDVIYCTLQYLGMSFHMVVKYSHLLPSENGDTWVYIGNATFEELNLPARIYTNAENSTISGRIIGHNYGVQDIAFVMTYKDLQTMTSQFIDAQTKIRYDKYAYHGEVSGMEAVADEHSNHETLRTDVPHGRFGTWTSNDYWRVTVTSPIKNCTEEGVETYDCQPNSENRDLNIKSWVLMDWWGIWYQMDSVEYVLETNARAEWEEPRPTTTPSGWSINYGISIGYEPFGVGFGFSMTIYDVLTHPVTNGWGNDYKFYFDAISVMGYFGDYNTEDYPDGTGAWIEHNPEDVLADTNVTCYITSYNHALFYEGGDMGWMPFDMGPASGSFIIRVH